MQGPYLRKYGVETTIPFVLFETDGINFKTDAAHAAGDTKIMKDEGAEANTDNAFTDEGQGYSIVLSATEMQAARIVVYVVDAATKVWLDTAVVVETYGHASAMHAFDLDTASSAQTGDGYAEVTSGTHGLSVIETLVDDLESRLTAARAGYLDELAAANMPADLDAVLADTNELQTDDVPGLIGALNDPTAAAITDAVWDEVLSSGAHATLFSAGKRLQNVVLRGGTAIAGGANYITFPGPWSATDNIYEDNIVSIVDGTGAAQTRLIVGYVGALRTAYVDRPWTIVPDATSEIELLPFSGILLTDHGLATAAGASTLTLAATATTVNDTYVGSTIVITSGTGLHQARVITAYDGATKIATVSPAWTVVPDNTSVYKVIPVGRTIVESVQTDAINAAALAADALAEINAEVVDALNVDTYPEPGQEDPPATASVVTKLSHIYKGFRNRITQTATELSIYNDAGTVVDQKATISDDTVTYDRGKIGTGP